METKTKKVAGGTKRQVIDTICSGEVEAVILLKRTPSGFRHHVFEPAHVWKAPGGRKMTSHTYSAHEEQDFRAVVRDASARCRELDAQLARAPKEAA